MPAASLPLLRLLTACLLGTGLFLLGPTDTRAQQIRAYVTVDSVSVGDRFDLIVAVDHEGDQSPVFPDTVVLGETTFGDLEAVRIVGRGYQMQDVSYSDARTDSMVVEVTTFALDTAFVAALSVPLVAEDAAETDTLLVTSAPFIIPVRSLVPEDAQDVQDLAPIVEFPRPLWPWLVGLLVLLLLLVGLFYVLRYRRRRPPPEAPRPEPTAQPYDEALNRLKPLDEVDLSDPLVVKPFYVELSDTLRTYLERSLHVNALEETTRELVQELRAKADGFYGILPEDVPEQVRSVLELSDLAKFADLRPPADEGKAALHQTRQTLDEVERAVRRQREREAAVASEPVEP